MIDRCSSFDETASQCLGMVIALSGVSVLFGWDLDLATLKSILPNAVTMKPNTAACFLLIGLCL